METLGISLEPARLMLAQIVAFMPRLLGALLIVVVGWLLAKAARFAIDRALRAVNFHVLTERAGLDPLLREGGSRVDSTALIAGLVYWVVLLATVMVAVNGLGFGYLADLISRVVWFVPSLFVALLVLVFGSYFARFVGDSVTGYLRRIRTQDAELLGRVARYAVLLFVVLIALDQVNVDGTVLFYTFLVILSGLVLTLALAFGLGGREWAARRLEKWWPSEEPPQRSLDEPRSTGTGDRRPPPRF